MTPLVKTTQLYACHQVPLEIDIYESAEYPKDGPVFLFFHAGGLVGGARTAVPPWLVQACYQRKWPLLSPDYRLLPQVEAKGLLDDAKAAFNFARTLGGQYNRRVIVGGASAGFFLATVVAHHLAPKPIALFCITGIPSFRHRFFNSSHLIPPEPIEEHEVEHMLAEPITVGKSPSPSAVFYLERLSRSGTKNPDFEEPDEVLGADTSQDQNRGLLYDYYLYRNEYEPMVGDIDPGYDWAREATNVLRLGDWPMTILIQGDQDVDVSPAVSADVAKSLGSERARYCLAKNQPHLFEAASYLEDEGEGMDAVRLALKELDKVVADF